MGLLTISEIQTYADEDDFGVLENFPAKNVYKKRPGLSVVRGPRFWSGASKGQFYLDRGVDGVMIPSGIPRGRMANLNPENQAVLSGRAFFNDPNGNILWRDYQDRHTDVAINYWLSGAGARFSSFDTKEDYDGHGMWYNENPIQYERFWKGIGLALEKRGQLCLGDYDGPFLWNNETATQNFRDALKSPKAAFDYCYPNPYFFLKLYNFGCYPIYQMYFRGSTNYHDRMWEAHATSMIAKMAMEYTGSGKGICSYTENVVNEFTGYNPSVRYPLPGGGEISASVEVPIDFDCMLTYNNWISQDCFVAFEFMDPQIPGRNPGVIQPDIKNYGGVQTYKFDPKNSGNNPIREEVKPWYDSVPEGYRGPLPSTLQGYTDAFGMGINIGSAQYDIVNTEKFRYPIVIKDGITYDPANYPYHQFADVIHKNRLPWVRAQRDKFTGRGWFSFVYYPEDENNKMITLRIDDVQQSFLMTPGGAQWFEFTSTPSIITN